MNLMNRYNDAYLVARTVDGAGQTIKVVGFAVAAVVAIGGLALGSKLGPAFGFGAVLLGALVALPFYAMGVLVSAQGQILKATLDTAVNSSPLLTQDEVRRILLQEGGHDPTSYSSLPRDPAKPDGRCPKCDSPFWYADYRRDASQLFCSSCRTEIPRPAEALGAVRS